ncbi:MAG: hypothetical protein ACR2OU_14240 [Thermomicrobiales bacterium]
MIGLPHIETHNRKRIDWLGAMDIIGSIVPLLLAFSWAGSEYAWGSVEIIGLLIVAVLFTAFFIWNETRAELLSVELRGGHASAIQANIGAAPGQGQHLMISHRLDMPDLPIGSY